ncbi:FAD-binding oxidoreductase [Streptomyces sp. H27-D2]|uniref:FAD-binding oxidoreductase n=1 Tax=Streptomyces sp. H27-D2 TaxID=3046304 RepID=UPI002DBEB937|nr:FAD-binding oxidoreductase [Streptomyces sp. H27-D2]MEC4015809.1 FAD-binding oxidoreductase [Streptomyces sp. H27-D2]
MNDQHDCDDRHGQCDPNDPNQQSRQSQQSLKIKELARAVRGPVFLPGAEGYDEERSGAQTGLRHRPAVIVGADGADDVRVAVEFARDHRLPVAVQATGHGMSVAAGGGVLISTRRMSGVRVDAGARTAWLEAGVRWERVVPEAARHGLAPLNGSAPHVGAVAYTLGGGLGLLSRQFGYAADLVRTIEVVTADARLRRITADSDPDLFWALLGGRDNFGVVTGLEIGLLPVTRLYGGGLYFDADLVEDVFQSYLRWTRTVPEEMSSSLAVLRLPDVPQIPEPIRGRRVIHVRIAYTGGPADGERLLAPLRAVGPRLTDTVEDMPYTACGTIHNDPSRPMAWTGDNVLLSDLDAPAVRTVLALTGPDAPVPCIVELRHLGGALARKPATANAVGHRDAQYLLGVLSPLGDDFGLDAVQPVHRRLIEALAPWSAGRNLNFMGFGENATAERVRSAYDPDDYRRLTELKAVFDPANTFRLNYNVPAAGSGSPAGV